MDTKCLDDFFIQNPKTFYRAFVSRVPKCDSIESNICETFNACIVRFRSLTLINMLEEMRGYMMSRLVTKVGMVRTTRERTVCLRIAAKIERGKLIGRNC